MPPEKTAESEDTKSFKAEIMKITGETKQKVDEMYEDFKKKAAKEKEQEEKQKASKTDEDFWD